MPVFRPLRGVARHSPSRPLKPATGSPARAAARCAGSLPAAASSGTARRRRERGVDEEPRRAEIVARHGAVPGMDAAPVCSGCGRRRRARRRHAKDYRICPVLAEFKRLLIYRQDKLVRRATQRRGRSTRHDVRSGLSACGRARRRAAAAADAQFGGMPGLPGAAGPAAGFGPPQGRRPRASTAGAARRGAEAGDRHPGRQPAQGAAAGGLPSCSRRSSRPMPR